MLDRLNVSVSVATMLAVLAKLAILFEADRRSWLDGVFSQSALYCFAIAFFLVFFRGKMMHDDSAFFADIESGKFKDDPAARRLAKIGLVLGYLSWMLWAPAIYFLEYPKVVAAFMLAAFFLSTIWLAVDILTRSNLDSRRVWWIVSNLLYLAGFGAILVGVNALLISVLLVLLLFIDWVASDPIGHHIARRA